MAAAPVEVAALEEAAALRNKLIASSESFTHNSLVLLSSFPHLLRQKLLESKSS